MTKRSVDETYAGDLVDCKDPKAEILKLTGSTSNGRPGDYHLLDEEFEKFSYLLKEAYAILYVVEFRDDKRIFSCVFSTSAKVDEFNETIKTLKTVIAKRVYAVSGWKEMHALLKTTRCGMPSRIDDVNYYVFNLMRHFNADFEFVGACEVFLEGIAGTKTSDLSHIEREYVKKIKIAYNEKHAKIEENK